MRGLTLGQFGALALSFVVVAIIIAMGSEILGQVRGQQNVNTSEYNITTKGIEGVETFGEWLPTIAVVVAAAVVIGVIIQYFQS